MNPPVWQLSGTASVYDILGDHIVFRNLQPLDPALPGLRDLRAELEIPMGDTPRKTTLDYARVIHRILLAARPGNLQRLIYIGDTFFNDGSAFRNIANVSGWDAAALIAAERPAQPAVLNWHPTPGKVQRLFTANRWGLVEQFRRTLENQSFGIDKNTAVVIDLDKTLLGARGRNDQVIDQARLQAAFTTAQALFDDFDIDRFSAIYDTLNQPIYHPVTADNQDFLVYICLLVYADCPPLEGLLQAVEQGIVSSFEMFECYNAENAKKLPAALRAMQDEFQARRSVGDPTPFKLFRHNEYLNTIQALRSNPSHQPIDNLLRESIVITAEVKAFADHCRNRGALLFAISDKPDEASLPTDEDTAKGYQPLHKVKALVAGKSN